MPAVRPMEQHIFNMSFIIEGTTENIQYIANELNYNEQKCTFDPTER